MGGLHSGRKRKHTCIDDCIELDLAYMRKQKLLSKPGVYSLTQKAWIETDFHKRREINHMYTLRIAPDSITVCYLIGRAGQPEEKHNHKHILSLSTTPCNYGGSRQWFISPCCGQRVRVLYISSQQARLADITPQCRNCLDLHYKSQMASYIEQHKTYERHLLRNYGLTYAAHRYRYELKAHYLEVTPELEIKMLQSQLDQHIKMIKLLVSTNRFFVRTDSRIIDSLKLAEDLDRYVCKTIEQHGPKFMQEVIWAMRRPEKRALAEHALKSWLARGKKVQQNELIDLARMRQIKTALEEEIAMLKAA